MAKTFSYNEAKSNIIKSFVIDKMSEGVIVFDKSLDIIFSNKRAKFFLKRHKLPKEIKTICQRIFDAIDDSGLKELFPGDIQLFEKINGSPGHWSFRIHICENPGPFVTVFAFEESLLNKIDLNRVRSQFGLTRRETDVLRCVLNGLRNSDIADEMEISEQTAKNYLSAIYVKLGVESRFAIANFLLNSLRQTNLTKLKPHKNFR